MELHQQAGLAEDNLFEHLAGAAFHVDRKGIDTDAAPSTLLECPAIRSDGAVTGTDVNEVAVRHAGEHSLEHPFVLTDLPKVLLTASEFAESDAHVPHERELTTLTVLRKELAGATAPDHGEGAKRSDDDDHQSE